MKDRRIKIHRVTTLLAATIATGLTLVAPITYFFVSYQYLRGTMDAQAELNADAVGKLVSNNPAMWIFEHVRLSELLERRSSGNNPEIRQILDKQGTLVAESKDHLKWPLLTREHQIYDAGLPVAVIRLSRSLFPLVIKTAVVALISMVTGVALFLVFRLLPMRAVQDAYSSLEENEKKYRSLYESMKEGVAVYRVAKDPSGELESMTLVDINPSGELILGVKRGDIIGAQGCRIFGEGLRDRIPEIFTAVENSDSYSFEFSTPETNRIFSASFFSPGEGVLASLVEDITDRKRSDEQIQRLAYYDMLTGLPNRLLLNDRLDQALARASRENGRVAVMFIDLDRFKIVNDTLGHAYGDLLLVQVSLRLRDSLRGSDTLARIGGDEFVVLLSYMEEELNAAHVAQHILDQVTRSYDLGNREIYTSASIGIAVFPQDGLDSQTLLRCADMAMYESKESGRSSFNFFSQDMNRKAHERMELEASLRHALEREEFFLEFQPIVNARNGTISSAEALVRWQHPGWGRTMPGRFIQVAEETNLVIPLGEWVLRTVCRKIREWGDAGVPLVRISVNVSGRQFLQKNFIELVEDILSETGIEPRYLDIELTETSLMENADETVKSLFRLKELGLNILVDDFGSGYSSLAYLKNFPIDRIKIDRSFVRDVCENPGDRAIVEAIIAMSTRLGLAVIAEGVETVEQLEFLLSRNCEDIQGFYYHRPMSEERFLVLLTSES